MRRTTSPARGPAIVWPLAPLVLALGVLAVSGAARRRSRLGTDGPGPPPPVAPARLEPGRGRRAEAPWRIPLAGWGDIVWRAWREAGRDRLTILAGGVTYYTLLSIFPALGVFVALYGLIADVDTVQAQLVKLSAVFPPEAVGLLAEQMRRLAGGRTASLSFAFAASLLLSIWSANVGMKTLFNGLNTVYEEVERRPYLKRVALTYAFTAALLVFLAVVSAILAAAPFALGLMSLRDEVLLAARWPLVFAVAVAAFAIAYRFAPCRRPARWRWLLPGAIAAAALWLGGSAGFSWYLNHVARLNITYGSLGAIVGFMLWIWFSVVVVLLGGELNAEIEHQTICDTTVGPPRPYGARGAVVADTLGHRFIGFVALRRELGRFWRRLLHWPPEARP